MPLWPSHLCPRPSTTSLTEEEEAQEEEEEDEAQEEEEEEEDQQEAEEEEEAEEEAREGLEEDGQTRLSRGGSTGGSEVPAPRFARPRGLGGVVLTAHLAGGVTHSPRGRCGTTR